MLLDLSPDELLSTTRSVRRRLDLERPVDINLIRECLTLALQAPSGGNAQKWHFVVVTDPVKKQALAGLYRRGWKIYLEQPVAGHKIEHQDQSGRASQERVISSAEYLTEHIHQVPVFVIPCFEGRIENPISAMMASIYGSILPATWSFMLAARARGLASCWTTLHLMFEEEAAKILDIPYDSVTQAALLPVAHALGTDFKPAWRKPLEEVIHIDQW